MDFSFTRNDLIFKRPAGTSRGVLTQKPTWFIELVFAGQKGRGEVSLIPGLSIDDENLVEAELEKIAMGVKSPAAFSLFMEFFGDMLIDTSLAAYRKKLHRISGLLDTFLVSIDGQFPAIRFAMEMALLDLLGGASSVYFHSDFLTGRTRIPINGLIWMGDTDYMNEQIEAKLEEGYSCLKLKIGALDFKSECKVLKSVRKRFSAKELELRVDANGAFSPNDVDEKLKRLSDFKLHSIEQPLRQGQWPEMARICKKPPLPIALDEELIGVPPENRAALLDEIQPQYIILKPSLLGGFYHADSWIRLADERDIGTWSTSALESNLGLSAIAQWAALYNVTMPQGLGTGKLFTNNLPSSLFIENGYLAMDS